MTDSFRTTPPQQQWSAPNSGGNGFQNTPPGGNDANDGAGEMGKALAVGVLGGLLSIAGYLVYRRLPDEQKEKLHSQARNALQQRISELRQNFNI